MLNFNVILAGIEIILFILIAAFSYKIGKIHGSIETVRNIKFDVMNNIIKEQVKALEKSGVSTGFCGTLIIDDLKKDSK